MAYLHSELFSITDDLGKQVLDCYELRCCCPEDQKVQLLELVLYASSRYARMLQETNQISNAEKNSTSLDRDICSTGNPESLSDENFHYPEHENVFSIDNQHSPQIRASSVAIANLLRSFDITMSGAEKNSTSLDRDICSTGNLESLSDEDFHYTEHENVSSIDNQHSTQILASANAETSWSHQEPSEALVCRDDPGDGSTSDSFVYYSTSNNSETTVSAPVTKVLRAKGFRGWISGICRRLKRKSSSQ